MAARPIQLWATRDKAAPSKFNNVELYAKSKPPTFDDVDGQWIGETVGDVDYATARRLLDAPLEPGEKKLITIQPGSFHVEGE